MEELVGKHIRWFACEECKKFYGMGLHEWMQHDPPKCPQGHIMLYGNNSVAWEQLTALYGLLASIYLMQPWVITFAQYQQAPTIIQTLKELE